jgi:acetylornithine deacetylase/succinyl-diaminopimelate desuccinylase-like protein|tara:strand:+ start:87 stop:239 length:153 start_codon:yes stop_codon:yes gene_type:complete
MNKTELFEAIEELVKKTNPPVNFKEIFVGDEEVNQVYYLFDNVKNADGGV